VFLGRFRDENSSATGLDGSCTQWTRLVPAKQFVKVKIERGRVIGAVLIGETDLEETIENLILNGTDVSQFGPEFLDPDFDVEDYFDWHLHRFLDRIWLLNVWVVLKDGILVLFYLKFGSAGILVGEKYSVFFSVKNQKNFALLSITQLAHSWFKTDKMKCGNRIFSG